MPQCDDCQSIDGCPGRCARAGQPWEPSNGTTGGLFIEAWCSCCQRDKVMNGEATDEQAAVDDSLYCNILSGSFRGEATEWQYGDDGQVKCIAFVAKGDAIPVPRCPHTLELPLEP